MPISLSSKKKMRNGLFVVIVIILLLTTRLGYIQLVWGAELNNQATSQQSQSRKITAKRGTIYDADWHGKIVTFLLYGTAAVHIIWFYITPMVWGCSAAHCAAPCGCRRFFGWTHTHLNAIFFTFPFCLGRSSVFHTRQPLHRIALSNTMITNFSNGSPS